MANQIIAYQEIGQCKHINARYNYYLKKKQFQQLPASFSRLTKLSE